MKTIFKAIGFFILVGVLSACITPPNPVKPIADAVAKIPAALRVAYVEADGFYIEMVKQEKGLTEVYQQWEENRSNWMTGAGETLTLVNQCYGDTAEVLAKAANAVFGKDANGNPVNPANENKAFINALGTGGSLYAGNVDRCQNAANDLMNYIRVNREKDAGTRNRFVSMLRTYDLSQVSNLKIAAVMRFYNQYGPEIAKMLANGEGALLDKIAAENGLEPLPYSFIGFPTGNLKVLTKSKVICDGYLKVYNRESPAPGGRNPELYQAEWDGTVGSCVLYRYAAYAYMNRLFVSAAAAEQFDQSEDKGLFPPTKAPVLGTPTIAPK